MARHCRNLHHLLLLRTSDDLQRRRLLVHAARVAHRVVGDSSYRHRGSRRPVLGVRHRPHPQQHPRDGNQSVSVHGMVLEGNLGRHHSARRDRTFLLHAAGRRAVRVS